MNPTGARELKIEEHTVLVDEEDFCFLSRYTWHIKPDKNTFYAFTNVHIGGRTTSISMHRMITGFKKSGVDHRNRNGLDNRKENLRFATNRQNSCNRIRANRHGYRGVYRPTGSRGWGCQIQTEHKRIHRYGFKTPEDAAREYDKLSKEHHGEFGIRNFKD